MNELERWSTVSSVSPDSRLEKKSSSKFGNKNVRLEIIYV